MTAHALADEYRRRRWFSIAEYLVYAESQLHDRKILEFTVDGGVAFILSIGPDPFTFFTNVLREFDADTSKAGNLCIMNACCCEYMFIKKRTTSQLLH